MRDGVSSARALFIASGLLAHATRAELRTLEELSRSFRVVETGNAPASHRGIELHASWIVGDAAGTFPGARRADAARGLGGALRAIVRVQSASPVIIDPAVLQRRAQALRRRGRRIVFTNGVFDLLHVGHLRLLEQARLLGDALVVGINSDDSTRAIKGPRRPVVPQFARAALLASLRSVDCCFIFTERDPLRVLEVLRPDVLAKGSDYAMSAIVGARFVRGYGGKVVRVPIVEGQSTSSTIGAIKARR